ncbi:hypothetical protein IV487_07850 [Enterococcus saccharolyticus]|uniref:hypothetical protein n=1 Tax=Enterococcus saccharolyticus TaxID=41997 RepID=UPI001E3F5256|nr:hypothetical protein [Enterococcus saccharolyticus]MCD5002371.1 hypothetical protein [Enterococcus saccharolyticus]
MKYKSYITDLHLNLHPDQIDLLEKWYEHSKKVSDFFTLAYYPYEMIDYVNGFRSEQEINSKLMEEQWSYITNFLEKNSKEKNYISFLGVEWQGKGLDGDHNVYFRNNNIELNLPATYEELFELYKERAIAIPHHLAYSLGNRGKNWYTHQESFSPFVETYSHHGSSERDRTSLSMDRHIHMGPRVDETSVIEGLKQGYHFGIIASGDNHEIPAMVKNGRAGIWAESYDKESIWQAFLNRRVFGFTDSKIMIWTEVQEKPMGSIFKTKESEVQMLVNVQGNNKIERIELYKQGELFDVQILTGKEINKEKVRFKFRIECGWGPNIKYFPEYIKKEWLGKLITVGKILNVEPVFNSFECEYTSKNEHEVNFKAISSKNAATHWMRDSNMHTEGFIFEIEAPYDSKITLEINEKQYAYSIVDLLKQSQLIVFEEEAKQLLEAKVGITDYYRSDSWYHNAYKIKLHQGALVSEYKVAAKFNLPISKEETSYFVKVFQADGQIGWSSPTWITQAD